MPKSNLKLVLLSDHLHKILPQGVFSLLDYIIDWILKSHDW